MYTIESVIKAFMVGFALGSLLQGYIYWSSRR